MKRAHVHEARHHIAISYPGSLSQRLYTLILGPLLIVAAVYFLIHASFAPSAPASAIGFGTVVNATLHTVLRLFIAYALAVFFAIPLALLVNANHTTEEILLPVFDVLQSVPILALFPVIVAVFINFDFLSGAAVFILFVSMLWSIIFTLVGGLKIIPKDIINAAQVFGVSGFDLIRKVYLPAIVPQLVTGSIIALASGWNIIIVAEVLRTYIPGGTSAQDLFGVGSILVDASASGNGTVFVEAVFVMIVVIALFNFFVWQKLLKFSQRFRFD